MTPTRRKSHRNTQEAWEVQRPIIERLYITENRSLDETIKIIRTANGFHANARQYKDRLKGWGLIKNHKASDMKVIVAKVEKRRLEEGKHTLIRFGGHQVSAEKLDHFNQRKFVKLGDKASPSAATPPGFEYCTPVTGHSSAPGSLQDLCPTSIGSSPGSPRSVYYTPLSGQHRSPELDTGTQSSGCSSPGQSYSYHTPMPEELQYVVTSNNAMKGTSGYIEPPSSSYYTPPTWSSQGSEYSTIVAAEGSSSSKPLLPGCTRYKACTLDNIIDEVDEYYSSNASHKADFLLWRDELEFTSMFGPNIHSPWNIEALVTLASFGSQS